MNWAAEYIMSVPVFTMLSKSLMSTRTMMRVHKGFDLWILNFFVYSLTFARTDIFA